MSIYWSISLQKQTKKIDGIYLIKIDYYGQLYEQIKIGMHTRINVTVAYDARISKDDEVIVFRNEIYSLDSFMDKIVSVNVGDKINFGLYNQDDDPTNGDELISWIVIDVDDKYVKLLSENILDCKNFNLIEKSNDKNARKKYLPRFIETDISSFLNYEFLNKAFTDREAKLLLARERSKVHLLTLDEYTKYFGGLDADGININSVAKGTRFAISQGLEVSRIDTWYYGCGSYWLETYHYTPEGYADKVMWCGMFGRLYANGQESYLKFGDGVRPVVVIDKKSIDYVY